MSVEALALRQDLYYTTIFFFFFYPDCIFTDYPTLYFAINSSTEDNSEFGLIIFNYKAILISRLDIKIFSIKRQDNRCNHLLARDSIPHSRFYLWVDILESDLIFILEGSTLSIPFSKRKMWKTKLIPGENCSWIVIWMRKHDKKLKNNIPFVLPLLNAAIETYI